MIGLENNALEGKQYYRLYGCESGVFSPCPIVVENTSIEGCVCSRQSPGDRFPHVSGTLRHWLEQAHLYNPGDTYKMAI